MPTVRSRTLQYLLVTALILVVSGPWAVLQTVAWVGMVVSYSRDNSIQDAISMTFDGEHPCRMCKVVKEGRESEKESRGTLNVQNGKFELFLEVRPAIVFSLGGSVDTKERFTKAAPRRDPPLLRPPIFA